jgi:hypothetical protein
LEKEVLRIFSENSDFVGFGEVYKGKYKGEVVAVKKLLTEGLSPNEVVDVFREFRREVWLSR